MLAHKNGPQTNRLIGHLARDFDVYVHIDRRSSLEVNPLDHVFTFREYESYWGSRNLILATLFLLKAAHAKGYDRYLLISAQDLPLRTNGELRRFFENNLAEYVDTGKVPRYEKMPRIDAERLRYYHPDIKRRPGDGLPGRPEFRRTFFPEPGNGPPGPGRFFRDGRKPRDLDYDFYGGSNWFNLTHSCVSGIFSWLGGNPRYIDRFQETFAGDEVFFQTILHQLDGITVENDCLRYVDWTGGPELPRILRMEDRKKLLMTGSIFARKFDETVDPEIIETIYEMLQQEGP